MNDISLVADEGISSMRSFGWIIVQVSRTFDELFNHVYKVEFKTEGDVINWEVQHRFKVYRKLFNELKKLNIILTARFPPTYFRSKFGIQLTDEMLENRTILLTEVIKNL